MGVHVGANTMTIAAQRIGMGIIPVGKCSFDSRILKSYRPTAIIGSVFKLLRLGRHLKAEGVKPADIAINKLVAGERVLQTNPGDILPNSEDARRTTRMVVLK